MAKIHVLEADKRNKYRVVIHTPMPAGSNQAGHSWRHVWLEAKKRRDENGNPLPVRSILDVGNMPGNITQAEADDIANGSTIEIVTSVLKESGSIDELIERIIRDAKLDFSNKYKHYGYNN